MALSLRPVIRTVSTDTEGLLCIGGNLALANGPGNTIYLK
jgi:hypothetical protein